MESTTREDRAVRFRALHEGPSILQLVNVWDAWSARTAAAAGAPAIGTTSFGVAAANGRPDGQRVPWARVQSLVADIVAAVDIPVSVDIEFGGDDPGRTVADVVAIGAVGVNIEDVDPARPGRLVAVSEQTDRLAAARAAGGSACFVNARCDAYFGVEGDAPEEVLLDRAAAYVDAGADGLFVPGLTDVAVLTRVTAEIGVPVNVMIGFGAPSIEELAAAGVRRTSQGGEPFVATTGCFAAWVADYLAGRPGPALEQLMGGAQVLQAIVH